jgi:uncharacterized protein YqgC (DUF456 family)
MTWIYYTLLLVALLFGLFVNILGLPGLWLMVASVGLYAWLTGFGAYVGWATLWTLIGLALAAEVVEFVAGGSGAKAAGGSGKAMWGAIVGALLGGFLLTIPVPIIGTIIGVCAGAFLGASIVTISERGDVLHSTRVGWGAAKGRFWGILSKLAFGAVMLVVAAVVALPLGRAAETVSPAPLPATVPASLPADNALGSSLR